MAMRGLRGLLAAVVLTVGGPLAPLSPLSQPSSAQQPADYEKDYRELLERNKALAEALVQSSGEIIKLFEAADEKAIQSYFDDRIAAIDKAIRAYDRNSDVWKGFTRIETQIKEKLEWSRAKARSDVRFQDLVAVWENNERDALKVRTDIEKESDRAKTLLENLKQDGELIKGFLQAGSVKKGLEQAKKAAEGLKQLNGNMQEMIDGLNRRLKGGVVP